MMIILDTNIISEMMRQQPDANALAWLRQQQTDTLFISSITIAEISYGLHALPEGKRRSLLSAKFELFIGQGFSQRIIGFHKKEAHIYGEIMGYRKAMGKPLSILDGQIAAIALANNMGIATRNLKDFTDCGLQLINPFEK